MLCDSHSTKPSSSMVGTSPVGFILRYSGVLLTPNCMPASMRSYLTPSSSRAQSAFFTLTEFVLPQILSMVSPESGTDHVFPPPNWQKTWSVPVFKSLRPGRLCGDRWRKNNRRRASRSTARSRTGYSHRAPKRSGGRVARRLRILAVVGDAHHHLGVALRLHGAAHDAEAHHRLAVFRDEAGDDRLVRALARADAVGMAARHDETRAPVLHRDAVHYHARAEPHVIGLDERHHHAGGIGRREIDRAALGGRAVAEVLRALRVDERGARLEVARPQELLRPNVHVVEIGHVAARIGEGELHRLDLQVQAVGAVDFERG